MVWELQSTPGSTSREGRRIRRLRGAKPEVSVARAIATEIENERLLDGRIVQALTIFLAGAECPFTCAFCDLWQYTVDGNTPPGAIPRQIRHALAATAGREISTLKLYNASNFFDPRAIPPEDDASIAALVDGYPTVVVEAHPKLVGTRCLEFSNRCSAQLEVAVGFESFHPRALQRLNKRAKKSDYYRAADLLAANDIHLRAFVLVGAPFVPPDETLEWVFSTARTAAEMGARHISLIPVRGGNGELERLAEQGEFSAPRLLDLEAALDRCLELDAVVTVDLWDLERFMTCPSCFGRRRERLSRINDDGLMRRSIECKHCGDR